MQLTYICPGPGPSPPSPGTESALATSLPPYPALCAVPVSHAVPGIVINLSELADAQATCQHIALLASPPSLSIQTMVVKNLPLLCDTSTSALRPLVLLSHHLPCVPSGPWPRPSWHQGHPLDDHVPLAVESYFNWCRDCQDCQPGKVTRQQHVSVEPIAMLRRKFPTSTWIWLVPFPALGVSITSSLLWILRSSQIRICGSGCFERIWLDSNPQPCHQIPVSCNISETGTGTDRRYGTGMRSRRILITYGT